MAFKQHNSIESITKRKRVVSLSRNTLVSLNPERVVTLNRNQVVSLSETSRLESELRPFTFTSPVNADYLEFIIKIYKGHNGVTEKLADVAPGDELIIHEVFGAIQYKGPGVFIAGGAGITPFIAIFRQLQATGVHPNNTLLFANHTTADIILKDELKTFLGGRDIDIIRYPLLGEERKILDKKLITACAGDHATYYYICGPDQFATDMIGMLHELNIDDQFIVFEQ